MSRPMGDIAAVPRHGHHGRRQPAPAPERAGSPGTGCTGSKRSCSWVCPWVKAVAESLSSALVPHPAAASQLHLQDRLSRALAGHHGVYFSVRDAQGEPLFGTAPPGLFEAASAAPASTTLDVQALRIWQVGGQVYRGALLRLRGGGARRRLGGAWCHRRANACAAGPDRAATRTGAAGGIVQQHARPVAGQLHAAEPFQFRQRPQAAHAADQAEHPDPGRAEPAARRRCLPRAAVLQRSKRWSAWPG